MKTRGWTALGIATLTLGALATGAGDDASAQSSRPPRVRSSRPTPVPPITLDAGTSFRARFGVELATTLMRSDDPEERLRGIERASAIGGPEARVLLAQSLAAPPPNQDRATSDPMVGAARRDGRALIAATRGLARELLEESRAPRTERVLVVVPPPTPSLDALDASAGRPRGAPAPDAGKTDGVRAIALVSTLLGIFASVDPAHPEFENFARAIAARALAVSGDPNALEALVTHTRSESRFQVPALAALRARAGAVNGGAVDWLMPPLLSPGVVNIAGEVGDLRAAASLVAMVRSADGHLREAAVVALARLGAPQTAELARMLLKDADPDVRAGAATALVKIGAIDAAAVVAVLLTDEATRQRAVGLASEVESADVVRLLYQYAAANAASRSDDDGLRRRAIAALSRHRSEAAAVSLARLVADPLIAGDAVGALGRSRAHNARELLEALARDRNVVMRRLGVRGLMLRALVHGVDRDAALEASRPLATSPDPSDRALFIQVHVALGALSVERGLAERDAPARAAAIMGAVARLDARTCAALTARRAVETDASLRTLLGLSFACPNGTDGVTSSELWERARDGGPDAPLALLGLGSRAHDRDDGGIAAWFSSRDPVIRSHVARGLGASARSDASGRLARALLYETDADVRRVLVRTLGARAQPPRDEDSPAAREALTTVAEWDPEEDLRALAEDALHGEIRPAPTLPKDVAWLSLTTRTGGAVRGRSALAMVQPSSGLAFPITFDRDGYAVVAGLPPGDIQLVLAPQLPTEQASAKDPP